MLVHFLQVAQHSAEFQLLTDDDLVGLFKADDLNIRSEDDACRVSPAH